MRKIQPIFDRSSARLVLTTGMANTICTRIGEPNYKVVNKLNSTYLAMHEHERDQTMSRMVNSGYQQAARRLEISTQEPSGGLIFNDSFYNTKASQQNMTMASRKTGNKRSQSNQSYMGVQVWQPNPL